MKKKLLAMLLILAMLAVSAVSCSDSDAGNDGQTAGESQNDAAETEAPEETIDSDPLPEVSLNGASTDVLIRTELAYEFMPDEGGADTSVSEAIYQRNLAVEEKYETKLNFIPTPGDWGNQDNFRNAITNSVLANDGAYDFVAGYQAIIVHNVAAGDFLDLNTLPYLELHNPWWTQKGIDALTVNNRCYIATGDITVSMLEYLYCMYYNKTLAANQKVGDLYALVDAGQWTHDKLAEISAETSEDVDGDGSMTEADRFAIISGGDMLRQYLVAYNTPVMSQDASGKPALVWNNERTISAVEKLVSFFGQNDEAFINSNRGTLATMFMNNQTLFMQGLFGQAAALRDMESDFGILPYPKFDEAQPDYLTSTNNNVSMICVPKTCEDPENTALIIEAMCRESTDTVSAAFYDVAMKSKYTRDEDTLRMIDLIRGSLSFDFGWVNSVVLNLGNSYQMFVEDKNTDFVSYYMTREQEYTANMDKILAPYFD